MKTFFKIVALAMLLCAPLAAHAQDVNFGALQPEKPNSVELRTGAEYAFMFGLGYARAVPLFDRVLVVSGDVTLPWADLDVSDYRLRAGAALPIIRLDRFQLIGGIAPELRGTKNDVARMTSFGFDFALHGGYYATHWFAAAELGVDWAMTTYVHNNAAYRRVVYADAKDGWYATPGANVRLGGQAGASFGQYDVILRLGVLRDFAGEPPVFPFYGTLGFGMHF